MFTPPPPGLLVAVEGIDGAGKSSLVPALAQACQALGREVVTSHEPTNGQFGSALRKSAQTGRLPLDEELELFLLDRKEHVANFIQPNLAAGRVVILDRYYFSTAAYQGARGADPNEIIAANQAFAPKPDLLLILDVDPDIGIQRVRARGDVPNAFEKVQELERARQIFLSVAPHERVLLDARPPADLVHQRGIEALKAKLAI